MAGVPFISPPIPTILIHNSEGDLRKKRPEGPWPRPHSPILVEPQAEALGSSSITHFGPDPARSLCLPSLLHSPRRTLNPSSSPHTRPDSCPHPYQGSKPQRDPEMKPLAPPPWPPAPDGGALRVRVARDHRLDGRGVGGGADVPGQPLRRNRTRSWERREGEGGYAPPSHNGYVFPASGFRDHSYFPPISRVFSNT